MSGRTVYTFAPLSVSFTRLVEGDQFQPWAFAETQYTADPVLGGTQVYLDVGGDTEAKLEGVFSCSSDVDRQTLKNGRGTTGVLSNSRGRSNTYTLVKATPIDRGDYGRRLINLVFVLRPS